MKVVGDVFIRNPYMEFEGLITVRDKMSGPLLGCKPAPETAEYCHEAEGDDAFSRLFQLMFIRRALADVVRKFNSASHTMLEYVFERES